MKLSKKIAIVLPSYFGQKSGGAEYQTFLLSKEFISRNFDLHYIFLTKYKNIKYNFYKCTFYPLKRIPKTSRTGLEVPLYLYSTFRFLNKINPDLIYTRGRSSLSIIALLYSKFSNTKSILHLSHDHNLKTIRFGFTPISFLKIIEQILFFNCLRHFDLIIAQTQYQSNKLSKKFQLKSIVIQNGLPIPQQNKIIKLKEVVNVLWIGNMKPIKQPEVFIELANLTSCYVNNVNFFMIGRPYKLSSLQDQLQIFGNNKFHLLGEISNDSVNFLLNHSHILVNTSLAEGFPNTFIQAWMRKVPVISLVVDPDNIINKYHLGFVSQCIDRLVIDLLNLIRNDVLREKMGNDAQIFALKYLSYNNILTIVNTIEKYI